MNAYFLDTFAIIALVNTLDSHHNQVTETVASLNHPIITTEWVIAEAANGLCHPNVKGSFCRFQDELSQAIEVVPLDQTTYEQGWKLYRNRPDKHWSLTDCISFVVMQSRGITTAVTQDHHFQQAGFITLFAN